jgi:uncharacterized membrane protein
MERYILDSYTFLKHLLWLVSLMLVLLVIFHFVLEMIDYNSFLLSTILIATVLVVLAVLFVWRISKKTIVRKIDDRVKLSWMLPSAPDDYQCTTA